VYILTPDGAEVFQIGNYIIRLDKIDYPNNITAKIIYDTASRLDYFASAIREIRISSGNNPDNVLRYKMEQSYWKGRTAWHTPADSIEVPYRAVSSGGGSLQHRLKLNGIRLLSSDGSRNEPYYTFDYHNTMQFPNKYMGGVRLFGYYNGNIPISFGSIRGTHRLGISYSLSCPPFP
jgi:hypothetical protein